MTLEDRAAPSEGASFSGLLVLVIEDEPTLAQTIELYLRNEGFRTERAGDGARGLELFRAARPVLVVLDLGLPKVDGLEVLREIRAESDTPVLILTARNEEIDELLGLGLGADNYLVKPVTGRKLIAHVKAVLRRNRARNPEYEVVRVGDLEIDLYRMEARTNGERIDLTPSEFKLLHHLARWPGRPVTRAELLQAALGNHEAFERTVDIHMTNLRRKLRSVGLHALIATARGIGYRLCEPE